MKRIFNRVLCATLAFSVLGGITGCNNDSANDESSSNSDTVTLVWYPNESGGDLEESRNEVAKIIEGALGKKVEHKLTTDYSVAIEAIANNTAGLAFMGAQGYIEAHTKNENVIPLVVNSGKSGTLDDAKYYSWIAVKKDNASKYQENGEYTIDNIQGKKMSFVSNSSTSGFKIPTSTIVSYFSKDSKWSSLAVEDLMEGGSDKFFQEVLYGGSHQGSAVNLLTGKSDVAAFCDTTLDKYVIAADGEFNKKGTTYKVSEDAAEPFDTLRGQEFTAIASIPVLNAPFVINTEVISKEEQNKLIEALTSDSVSQNTKIFVPKSDETTKGFFTKEGDEKFISVNDNWFDPIREL